MEGAQADLGAGMTALQTQIALGGGAAAYDKALPGVRAGAAVGSADVQTDIAALQGLKAQFPGQAAQFDALIAQQRQRDAQMQGEAAQVAQTGFRVKIGEDVAGFGLATTEASYGGESAVQMGGLAAREAAALRGFAGNSLADPALAAQLRTQARTVEFQQAQAVYGQEEGALDVTGARRSGALIHAQQFGTTGDVQAAQGGMAQQELDAARQLNSEIERGNLTYDQRLEKQKEIVEHTAAPRRSRRTRPRTGPPPTSALRGRRPTPP